MKSKRSEELDRIIKRINVIEKKRPSHKEILDFFKCIIREQHKIKPLIKVKRVDINEETAKNQMREGFPLIDKKDMKLNMDLATTLFKNICRTLQRNNKKASPEIKKINQAIRKSEIDLKELFGKLIAGDKAYIDSVGEKTELNRWLLLFLAESSINPFFEAYADKLKGYVDQESWFRNYCPVCGSQPVIGELRNTGGLVEVEGARFLVCSSCGFEWRFKRLACPFCGNENHEKLRYFNTEADGKGYRVDVCEECKKYIKAIDLRELNVEVVPLVEDMGTLHLDILARKEGYKRGVPGILEMEKSGE
ncbi:MAG: formate dehydrogenase accessory protein FdhE [Thermodesulfovibrionales bacterium]